MNKKRKEIIENKKFLKFDKNYDPIRLRKEIEVQRKINEISLRKLILSELEQVFNNE